MTGTPSISVIIPLYNKAGYVVRAIRSALRQEPPPAEILIVDDGSTDEGPALIEQLPEFPRLRLVRQQNGGEGAARNRGLAEMRGDLAAFLDADDEWAPGHLRNLLELAAACPAAGLLATGYRAVYGRGVQVETAIEGDRPVQLRDYFETARGGFCLHVSSCAVWRRAIEEVGGFAEREPMGADLEFIARVALSYPVAVHPAISGIYYAGNQGSAIHSHRWKSQHPPVVRLLRAAEAAGKARASARDYSDWILVEHALTGLCCGRRREALMLLDELSKSRGRHSGYRWWLRTGGMLLPLLVLRTLIRLRRSRLAVTNVTGRHTVINRVVYSNV
jgi:glycosyltransferase involved in cell wall biosynthesis